MLPRISIILGLIIGIALAALVYRISSIDSLPTVLSFMDQESRPELFSTLHEVMPSSPILASTRPRLLLPLPGSFEPLYTWQGQEKSLDDLLQETRGMGLMVLRDGGILAERYTPGLDRNTPVSIWTASEAHLSTLVGIAVQKGLIESLEDPVEKYARSFKGTEYGQVPIRNLLDGNSSMDFAPGIGLPIPDHLETYLDLVVFPPDLDTMAHPMRSQAERGTERIPLPTDPHVLSAVIQGAWGDERSLVEILQDELWEPLGFGGNAFWVEDPTDPDGRILVRCCLSMRLLDFAHLGQVYLEDGSFRGERYLPTGWTHVTESTDPESNGPGDDGSELTYGSGFWVPADCEDEFMALGSFGQALWIDRVNQVVIAHVSAGDELALDERIHAYRAIAQAARMSAPFVEEITTDPGIPSEVPEPGQ